MFGLQKKSLRIKATLSLVGALLLTWLAVGSIIASAHADRLVDGKYGFRVGFLNEPAYTGLQNGVDLSICMETCSVKSDGSGIYTNPVSDPLVYQTISVTVIYGGSQLTLPLTPVFQRPGKFSAMFIPTSAGDYTFHFTGKIGSDKIDESFNSATDGFDAVQDVQTIQFPNKISVGGAVASQPTAPPNSTTASATTVAATSGSTASANTTVAATTIAAATASSDVQNQLAATSQELQTTQSQLAEARNSANAATTFAIIGIIVGLIGVLVAVVAVLRSGRNRAELG